MNKFQNKTLDTIINLELDDKNSYKQPFKEQFKDLKLTDVIYEILGSVNKILNKDGALTLLITIDKDILNSKDRDKLMQNLITLSVDFESKSGIKLHYAGLPYSRYIMAESVKEELSRLLIISLIVI